MLKRVVAFGLLAASLAGCGGSGGHGGSGNATPAAVFKDVELKGDVDAPNRAGNTTASFRISNGEGVASFVRGTQGSTSFLTYSAEIANVVYVADDQPTTPNAITGTIAFDLQNFTSGSPYASPMHYGGRFVFTGSGSNLNMTFTGALTGTDIHGTAVNATLNPVAIPLVQKFNLTGTYHGTIELNGQSVPWSGTLSQTDELHLAAAIQASPIAISFTGANVKNSFAGEFDGAQVGIEGAKGLWYVESTDGASLKGAYVVIDAASGIGLAGGKITATKGSTGGGTASSIKTGYYDGGMIIDGATGLRIFKLDIKKNSATTGENGAMVIVTNSSAENIGGRVASITGSGNNVVITIDNITNRYTTMVLTGTISGTTLNVTYSATLVDGSTETGSFDSLGRVTNVTTPNLTGSWTGSLTGSSGPANTFQAAFVQDGDKLTITPSQTTTIGTIPIPTIHAYVAGTSFAGRAAGTGLPAFVGDFDADVNGTGRSFTGSFSYTASGSGNSFSDAGTFTATKN